MLSKLQRCKNKTRQELRMLSSVPLHCHVTMIVLDWDSPLSDMSSSCDILIMAYLLFLATMICNNNV